MTEHGEFSHLMGAGDDEDELPVVAAPSAMTDEVFLKHFNARHHDGLHGQADLEMNLNWSDQIATFRSFHRKIHDGTLTAYAVTHTHSKGSREHSWQDGA